MRPINTTVRGFAIYMLSLYLSGWNLVSAVSAATIVVTTLGDEADHPFNADGPCGAGTVSDLPGADGQVSLREAIIATNNTNGANTITFAPNLSGGTIFVNFDDLDGDTFPDPLPALCGGQTTINGDLNDDGTPDITLEGGSPPALLAGIAVVSSHNTVQGLQVQHFVNGIAVIAGRAGTVPETLKDNTVTNNIVQQSQTGILVLAGLTGPATIKHTTVTNNIVQASPNGISVLTGNAPGSILTHTSIAENLVRRTFIGILVQANTTAAGADTNITHTRVTDNEVGESTIGILTFPQGTHNRITHTTIANNMVFANTLQGIQIFGGIGNTGENGVEVSIQDNMVTDNQHPGIRVVGGADNSSNNYVVAKIQDNSLERNLGGIVVRGGFGAAIVPGGGTSTHNVVDVSIERNTLKENELGSISIFGGSADLDENNNAIGIANNNEVTASVTHNVVKGDLDTGIGLAAGGFGLASANTLDVWVAQNTVCGDGRDIIAEGGFSDTNVIFSVPNQGNGNVLVGEIFQNTATEVIVTDGTQNGVPANTATVKQFQNNPCP
ncbi:MAG: hypothetical protein AB7G75_34165 [Candidatus Binatia bacterium]